MVKFLETFLRRIRLKKDTVGFSWVEKDKGVPVGPPIIFDHWEPDDKMRSEAQVRLIKQVQLGLRANAIRVPDALDTERIGGGASMTTIQPCWV